MIIHSGDEFGPCLFYRVRSFFSERIYDELTQFESELPEGVIWSDRLQCFMARVFNKGLFYVFALQRDGFKALNGEQT